MYDCFEHQSNKHTHTRRCTRNQFHESHKHCEGMECCDAIFSEVILSAINELRFGRTYFDCVWRGKPGAYVSSSFNSRGQSLILPFHSGFPSARGEIRCLIQLGILCGSRFVRAVRRNATNTYRTTTDLITRFGGRARNEHRNIVGFKKRIPLLVVRSIGVCDGDSDSHHDVRGRQESDSNVGIQDGAHMCAIYVRIRDGVRRPSSTLCHWLGGTRRSSGRGLFPQQQQGSTCYPCPVFQEGKALFYQGRSQGQARARSGRLIAKNVERVVTTTPI